jgi:hypothetical protein
MCLELYIGCDAEIALRTTFEFSVEPVEGECNTVRRWFSVNHVYSVSAHGQCACAFPHVIAETPIEYYDGFFDDDDDDRSVQLASMRAIFDLVSTCLSRAPEVQFYPVWEGEQDASPRGKVEVPFSKLQPGIFFFTEQFLYRIRRDAETHNPAA